MNPGHMSKVCRTYGERVNYGYIAILLNTSWSGELCLGFDATNDKNEEYHAIGVTKRFDDVCTFVI